MLLFFLFFTIIHIFSLSFNMLLFLVIFTSLDHSRLPTVYIYNMLLANCGEIITVFFIHLLPILLPDDAYTEFRNTSGALFTLSSTFSYEHPIYLTILMIIQRIWCVVSPMNRVFSDRKLWCYCGILVAISLISLLIPFFSDCQINVNQRTFTYQAACAPDRHPITLWQNQYLYLIPVGCMALNIGLILYLSYQKYFLVRTIGTTFTVTTMSSIIRQNLERTLLFQSVATTTFLLTYELSGVFIRSFKEEYSHLSIETQRFIFYSRVSTSSLLCFLVYFVGTPSIRALILNAIRMIFTKNDIKSSSVSSRAIT